MTEDKREKGPKKQRNFTSHYDKLFFFYDEALKALIELWDDFLFVQSRVWGPIFGRIVVAVSRLLYFTLQSGPNQRRLLRPLRILIGLAIAIPAFILMVLMILAGGTLAAIFGLRNLGEYTAKEELLAWGPLLLFFIATPFFGSAFVIDKLSYIFCYTVMLIGFDFLYGQCGILTLGHAGFAFMGSFLTAFFYTGTFGYQVPFLLSILLSSSIVAAVGFLLGLPSLRVKDEYLLIMTLAFAISINAFFKSHYLSGITGVSNGGLFFEEPNFLSYFRRERIPYQNYYFILVSATVMIFFAHNVMRRSQIGRAFNAIRCDHEVSKILGISLMKYKILAFALSAFYAAFAGGMASLLTKFVSIENYKLFDSVDYYVAIVIGGLNSILGSALGGVFLAFQIDISQFFGNLIPRGQHLIHVFYGLALIITIYFSPRGAAGIISEFIKQKLIPASRRGSHYMFTPPDFSYRDTTNSPVKRR